MDSSNSLNELDQKRLKQAQEFLDYIRSRDTDVGFYCYEDWVIKIRDRLVAIGASHLLPLLKD